jgi:hypothetical protein
MTRISDSQHSGDAGHSISLQLPDDWDDGTAQEDLYSDDATAMDDQKDLEAQSRAALPSNGPPNLVKAMFALDEAKTQDDIISAREILRVTGF